MPKLSSNLTDVKHRKARILGDLSDLIASRIVPKETQRKLNIDYGGWKALPATQEEGLKN